VHTLTQADHTDRHTHIHRNIDTHTDRRYIVDIHRYAYLERHTHIDKCVHTHTVAYSFWLKTKESSAPILGLKAGLCSFQVLRLQLGP
jgi:hypothetical protein